MIEKINLNDNLQIRKLSGRIASCFFLANEPEIDFLPGFSIVKIKLRNIEDLSFYNPQDLNILFLESNLNVNLDLIPEKWKNKLIIFLEEKDG